MGAVEGIGIADVERKVELAVRIHRAGAGEIESLRHLPVALRELRAKGAAGGRNRVGAEELELFRLRVFHKELKLLLLLEGADENRGAEFQAILS